MVRISFSKLQEIEGCEFALNHMNFDVYIEIYVELVDNLANRLWEFYDAIIKT
jgi:hypothetical protein